MWKFCSIDRQDAIHLKTKLQQAEKILKEKQKVITEALSQQAELNKKKMAEEKKIREMLYLFLGRMY